MRVCGWCEKPLVGRQRKWCSENCRKRGCDDAHRARCVDCGARMATGTGFKDATHPCERCRACEKLHRAAAHRMRLEHVAAMYRKGMSYREIAAALGQGPNSKPVEVTEARRLGLIDGYRYPAWESKRLTEGVDRA